MDSKISEFVAVTGASLEDARGLLEACHGDLDMAVNMHMETKGGGGVSEKSYKELHGVRAPIPQRSGVLMDQGPSVSTMRSRRLPTTVFDPFQDYSKVSSKQGDSGKLRNLADLFKPPFDIIFTGTFEELKMAGQVRKRWLLVNLQDSKQFASQVLNRDVWSHEGVRAIVSEHFLLWQIHKITDEGLRFQQLYHVNTFPYIAIVDPRTGEKMVDWETLTVTKFIPELREFLHSNSFDDDARETISDEIAELSEEQQLEAAIRASLRETERKCRRHSQQNGDSDEFVSLSSGDDNDGDLEMEHDEEREGDSSCKLDHRVTLDSQIETYHYTNLQSDQTANISKLSSVMVKDGDRKRKSSDDESTNPPQRKMLRTSTFEDPCLPETKVANTCIVDVQSQLKTEKVAVSNWHKGKQRISASTVSVEEKLELGELKKADVSQIVIRLPDGARIQKAFMSNSPIEELFTYLSGRGIDCAEHAVVTNFPRRILQDMNHFLTFKEANLYPSITVFLQD